MTSLTSLILPKMVKLNDRLLLARFQAQPAPTLKRSEKGLIMILHRRLKLLGALHNFCLDFTSQFYKVNKTVPV